MGVIPRGRLVGRFADIEQAIPKLVANQREQDGRQADDECFFRSMHQPHSGPCEQRPTQLPAAPIPPAGSNRQRCEENQ